MDWQHFTSLTREQMESLWNFNCKDPFSFLGIHPLETDRGLKTVIRTYQPDAVFVSGEAILSTHTSETVPEKTTAKKGTKQKKESVDKHDSLLFDFIKLGDTGFFEASLDMEFEPFFYKLNITLETGIQYSAKDPYAFLPYFLNLTVI
jgi:1,4-alpha-glucan branching enzyme